MTDTPITPAALVAEHQAEVLDVHPDPLVATHGHCKDGPHLRIISVRGVGHVDADQMFRELLEMVCPNTHPPTNPWGAVIDPTGKQEGMHFLPGGVKYLATWFPHGAAEARADGPGFAVGLQHTDKKVLTTWRLFVPDTADALGAAAAALCAKHGL